MASEHLRRLRLAELDQFAGFFPPSTRLLEIGAGAGWQAAELVGRGFQVEALDVIGSGYARDRVFRVREYDGVHLPFAEASFDGIYSSNVLEHVPDVAALLVETARVLRPDGLAVHVLPTSTWRLWTTLAHPASLVRRAAGRQARGLRAAANEPGVANASWRELGTPSRLVRALLPPVHGERGNFASELGHFRRSRWQREFARAGWRVTSLEPNRLFYTGGEVLGLRLSLNARARLSSVLGSSCLVWALTRVCDPPLPSR